MALFPIDCYTSLEGYLTPYSVSSHSFYEFKTFLQVKYISIYFHSQRNEILSWNEFILWSSVLKLFLDSLYCGCPSDLNLVIRVQYEIINVLIKCRFSIHIIMLALNEYSLVVVLLQNSHIRFLAISSGQSILESCQRRFDSFEIWIDTSSIAWWYCHKEPKYAKHPQGLHISKVWKNVDFSFIFTDKSNVNDRITF